MYLVVIPNVHIPDTLESTATVPRSREVKIICPHRGGTNRERIVNRRGRGGRIHVLGDLGEWEVLGVCEIPVYGTPTHEHPDAPIIRKVYSEIRIVVKLL